MISRVWWRIRQLLKGALQLFFLPLLYEIFKRDKIEEGLVLFADAKNDNIPFSMRLMYEEASKHSYTVQIHCMNFAKATLIQKAYFLINFMKQYANAEYIFICDYFLPVSSCKKRKETFVVQLWHAGGILKKFGYDAADDLGNFKWVRPTNNFDLVTVSSEKCIPIYADAFRLPEERIQALGISRTDYYFKKDYHQIAKETFYRYYPELKEKKIILWAPTFRGKAVLGEVCGWQEIIRLQNSLGEKYKLLIKLHPHLSMRMEVESCSLPIELLYSVADILITDYSSTVFDYSLLGKPFILFVPDFNQYALERGWYINLKKEMSAFVAENYIELVKSVKTMIDSYDKEMIREFSKCYMSSCDGNSTKRIWTYVVKKQNHSGR